MKTGILGKLAIILAASSMLLLSVDAEARGRTGSHRVGGHSSHGKGSHYVGGHVGTGHGHRR